MSEPRIRELELELKRLEARLTWLELHIELLKAQIDELDPPR